MSLLGGASGEGISFDGGFGLMKPVQGAVNEEGGEDQRMVVWRWGAAHCCW